MSPEQRRLVQQAGNLSSLELRRLITSTRQSVLDLKEQHRENLRARERAHQHDLYEARQLRAYLASLLAVEERPEDWEEQERARQIADHKEGPTGAELTQIEQEDHS